MISKLIQGDHILTNVKCESWDQLVDITGEPLIKKGLIECGYLHSVKETINKYGSYMVLLDDIAFFHGRPDSGVHELCMTLALLKNPIFLLNKRIKAAFMFAAVDNKSHQNLLKELAQCMNDNEFLELLLNSNEPDAIIKKLKEVEERYEVS